MRCEKEFARARGGCEGCMGSGVEGQRFAGSKPCQVSLQRETCLQGFFRRKISQLIEPTNHCHPV